MTSYLLNVTETYRVETEHDALKMIDEARNSATWELSKYGCQKKEIKQKGEILDEYYKVTLTKTFTNEKEPEQTVTPTYEVR